MSNPITSFAHRNALPFLVGAAAGFLGSYAIKWLKGSPAPTAQGTLHIINFTADGKPEIKQVTLQEFQTKITNQELNDLRKSVGWGERTDTVWQKILEKSTFIVCVKKHQQLVGFGSFIGNGRMGEFIDIHVHPKHQKQGLGILIMNHLITQIQSEGSYFSVDLFGDEDNPKVLDFYAKFGFQKNSQGMKASCSKLTCYKG